MDTLACVLGFSHRITDIKGVSKSIHLLVLIICILQQVGDGLGVDEGGVMHKWVGMGQLNLRDDNSSVLAHILNPGGPDGQGCDTHERRIGNRVVL